MWFDEHNHPVDDGQLSPQERQRAHRERGYKLASRLQIRGDYSNLWLFWRARLPCSVCRPR